MGGSGAGGARSCGVALSGVNPEALAPVADRLPQHRHRRLRRGGGHGGSMPCTMDGARVLPLGGAAGGRGPGSQDVVLGGAALFRASPSRRSARGLARDAPSPCSRPLPPAVLPCLQVCPSAGVTCALLLKHLVLDNLWIIANSR